MEREKVRVSEREKAIRRKERSGSRQEQSRSHCLRLLLLLSVVRSSAFMHNSS